MHFELFKHFAMPMQVAMDKKQGAYCVLVFHPLAFFGFNHFARAGGSLELMRVPLQLRQSEVNFSGGSVRRGVGMLVSSFATWTEAPCTVCRFFHAINLPWRCACSMRSQATSKY